MAKLSFQLTLLLTATVLTACGAKSKSNNAASAAALPAVTSTTPQALVAAASLSTVAPGGTVTFSVIGGTAPYTWTIQSGGGSMSSTTGASITYTAGSSIGVAFLSVTDANNNSANATVTISSTNSGASGNVCSGNYSATLGSYPASFQFQTSGTTLTGYLTYAGYQYPLVGTCDTNAINFTLTNTGDTFTGSFVTNTTSTRSSMQGTYNNVYFGTTQTWTATPQ